MFLGTAGSTNSQLNTPYGLVLDSSSGTLYISDTNNHRVMRYLSGASSGTVVAGGNGLGTGTTQLNSPYGLYFDSSSNSLVIANFGCHNIVRWVLGSSTWTLLAGTMFGVSGFTSTTLSTPSDVTFDSYGNMYVADSSNNRIQFFLSGQSNATTIAGTSGSAGTSSVQMDSPQSVALDSQLNLYVADMGNDRVQKFLRY
jgi:sugar lactone lactonase YvrE